MLAIRALSVVACLMFASSGGTPVCGGHGNKDTLVVPTVMLSAHLRDPNLVILAVGRKSEYDEGHIPGARFLEYMDTHTMAPPGSGELSVELPPMAQLVEVFEKLGVTNQSHIVLYETKDWASPTARVFLTLDAMGLGSHAAILDGGFPVWKNEGRPVTTELPAVTKGHIEPCPQTDVIADLKSGHR